MASKVPRLEKKLPIIGRKVLYLAQVIGVLKSIQRALLPTTYLGAQKATLLASKLLKATL